MKTNFTALLAAGCALALSGCNGSEDPAHDTMGAEASMDDSAMEDDAMAGEAEMAEPAMAEEDDPVEGTGNPIGPMAPAD